MEKTAVYLLYFCIYSMALLIIGKGSLQGGTTPRDYFICQRSVPLPLCVCTFTGTWVSAITILSLTGSVYEDGLGAMFFSVVPWFIGALLLGLITRRLYENNVITVPELFRVWFGSRWLQRVYGCIFIAVYIFYLVCQYKGFGMAVSAMFDVPYPVAVCMVYLFIMYTTFGGYRSVVSTDMFNLILLVAGLGVVFCSVVSRAGGLWRLYAQARLISGPAHAAAAPTRLGQLLSVSGGRYTPLVSFAMFWGWGLGLSANPQYIIRLLAARDSRTAQRTILCSLALLAAIYFALVHIGLGMRVLVPALPDAMSTDDILVYLLNNELYNRWSGFLLLCVMGACISTANSQLLLIATSFAYDVAQVGEGDRSERKVVNLGRVAVLGGGLAAMVFTLDPPDFTLSYGGDLWGVLAIVLFPPLYGTLLTHRVTCRGVWACLVTGGASIAVLYPLYYLGRLPLHPAMFGVPVSTLAMAMVSLWDNRRREVTE